MKPRKTDNIAIYEVTASGLTDKGFESLWYEISNTRLLLGKIIKKGSYHNREYVFTAMYAAKKAGGTHHDIRRYLNMCAGKLKSGVIFSYTDKSTDVRPRA